MQVLFASMLGWLPLPLYAFCVAFISIFFFMTALHLVRFILELIPFL